MVNDMHAYECANDTVLFMSEKATCIPRDECEHGVYQGFLRGNVCVKKLS